MSLLPFSDVACKPIFSSALQISWGRAQVGFGLSDALCMDNSASRGNWGGSHLSRILLLRMPM